MMPDHPLLVAWIRNGRLLFLVGLSGAENFIGENQQCVSDRDDRRGLLAPRLGGDPPELVLEETILLGRSSPSALGQSASEPPVAAGGMTAPILTRTPIVARTNPGPRTQVLLRRKLRHVRSGFGQNGGGAGLLQPRHALHQAPLWFQTRFSNLRHNILVQLLDLLL